MRKPARILDVLNEIKADIVFLQEVDRRVGDRKSTISQALLTAHSDYQAADVAIRSKSLGWHGNAILVRNNIKINSAWRMELPVVEPRGAVVVDIVVEGITLRCVGTHLGLLARSRRLQVKAIADILQENPDDHPTIIAGDFNEWSNSNRVVSLFGDRFTSLEPLPSFHSALPVAALDRIIISNTISSQKTSVHRSKISKIASDHLPLWADLHLPGQAVPG